MLTYYVENFGDKSHAPEKILHIEGDVRAKDLEKLHTCLFDTLNSPSDLTVSLDKLENFEPSFVGLFCCFRRTARLFNKKVFLQGLPVESLECPNEQPLPEGKFCDYAGAPECYLFRKLPVKG